MEKDPLTVFCRLCRSLGYELYEMDLVSAGEDFYATMRRSTNGGGENSPKLEGEDEFLRAADGKPGGSGESGVKKWKNRKIWAELTKLQKQLFELQDLKIP